MTKFETLKTALDARNAEIEHYQINIDNFCRAIAKIDQEYAENSKMIEFQEYLSSLLSENQTEQLKSIIIRDVIADQLTEMEKS
jgi:hypothetical protein